MGSQVQISFAVSAVADMDVIRAYYVEKNLPEVADRLLSEIIAHIEVLVDHPDIGRIVPEFEVDYLRELIYPPFRIVYRREVNKVRIVRVWRSERLLKLPPVE